MDKFIDWHKNIFYKTLEIFNISSYQAAWISFGKGLIFGIIIMCLFSCSTANQIPVKDDCCKVKTK